MMDAAPPRHLRDNAPIYAISAILVLAFAALALFGNVDDQRTTTPAPPPATAPLEALPATAQDEGTIISALAPGDAQARNAAVPFADTDPAAARPFAFRGNAADRMRARDCLALAAMAEAGAGNADQRAVMQVILNRVRHPAFAKTVCGVVFQGSERPTGCQFTFTCDGSLARTYADARWRGWWGTNGAMSARYAGGEPDPLALRETAQEVERPADLLPRLIEQGAPVRTITAASAGTSRATVAAPARGPGMPPSPPEPGVHFVLVARGDAPAALVDRARALCPGDSYCQVYGWDSAEAIPTALPLTPEARRALRFSFLPARAGNPEAIYFDCGIFAAPGTGTCLPRARP